MKDDVITNFEEQKKKGNAEARRKPTVKDCKECLDKQAADTTPNVPANCPCE